jgi:CBS domain-containing protein
MHGTTITPSELGLEPVIRIGPDTPLLEAARLLATTESGVLILDTRPVVEVTEHDIVRAVGRGLAPETPVVEVARRVADRVANRGERTVSVMYERRTRLEVLDREECLRLLERTHIGRLGLVVDGRPLVFPVNYAMDRANVVFRTAPGTKLHAMRGHSVAFEIDGADTRYHTGWSVLVTGIGEEEHDPYVIARYERLPVRPWADGPKTHWMRVRSRAITGRRIPPHGAVAACEEEEE